ncbi:thermonuclease family protein [Microvirga sp. 17 mud 1-3]|uniref:thermonuclease family protein n=1 Tax=Microvirga sp. 17 mud 1-3 TaxID=2082949 RepID=UPI000D6D0C32|nr:thermonuclease family protein [Microvirga sp. 17 mud 1-3]AWM85688.1 DNA-binding protein [Microvirga sp. 17 mud 1-3]
MGLSVFRGLAVLLPCALLASQGQAAGATARPQNPTCATETTSDRLSEVTPAGDLVLASGGPAKLAEIRLPETTPARSQAEARLKALIGRQVLVGAGPRHDRWGRLPIRIRPADDAAAGVDIAEALVEAGLALVDPGPSETLCRPELLALEETARERNLGLWADALYKPIDADQISRLQDRFGTFTLVEGRVNSIGERKQRVYLNFGRHWAEDFTIIIPQRTWRTMTARGLSAANLKGRRIRVRGILEPWQGAALTVVVPEMIQRLDGTHPSH